VIEVDGDIHDNQKDVDMVRTWRFENYGYRVIRFSNEMVLNRLEIVLAEIIQTALTSNPSPNSGRWEKKVLAQTHSPDTGRQDTAPLPLESGEGAGDEVA
jgi:hypothetical protein